MLLTDKEIWDCYERSHGNTEYTKAKSFARAVIAAYEAKLRDQEPVGYLHKSKDDNSWDHLDFDSYDDEYGKAHWDSYPIYLHPAPIPEGWISVDDRLPTDGTYLCRGHAGTHFICLMRNGRWFRQSAAKVVVGIAHWMPLPKPPRAAARGGE